MTASTMLLLRVEQPREGSRRQSLPERRAGPCLLWKKAQQGAQSAWSRRREGDEHKKQSHKGKTGQDREFPAGLSKDCDARAAGSNEVVRSGQILDTF